MLERLDQQKDRGLTIHHSTRLHLGFHSQRSGHSKTELGRPGNKSRYCPDDRSRHHTGVPTSLRSKATPNYGQSLTKGTTRGIGGNNCPRWFHSTIGLHVAFADSRRLRLTIIGTLEK